MRISSLRTDPALEKTGAWVQWIGDARLKLRRSGNPEYVKAVTEALKPYRALIRADALPVDTLDAIQRRATARYVLVDWDGFETDDDEPIPYSAEMSEQFLKDPRYHDLYAFVLTASSRMENYRVEEKEEDLGNSSSSSNGRETSDQSRGNFASSLGKAEGSQPLSGFPRPERKSGAGSARSIGQESRSA